MSLSTHGCMLLRSTKLNGPHSISTLTISQPYSLNCYLKLFLPILKTIIFLKVTMITVGYGDISPKTVAEKVLSVLNMMIACGQFAYSVNSIGNIFS